MSDAHQVAPQRFRLPLNPSFRRLGFCARTLCAAALCLSPIRCAGPESQVTLRRSHSSTREAVPEQQGGPLAELAARVQKAYEDAKYLTVEGHLTGRPLGSDLADPPYRLRVEARMAPGKLRSKVFAGENLDEPLAQILFNNGMVQEIVWEDGVPTVTSYPAPTPIGAVDILHKTPAVETVSCLFGSFLSSWVGEHSRKARYFAKGIARGRLLPDRRVDGRRCTTVLWDSVRAPDGYHRQDRYYIDKERFLVLRWDTLESEDGATPVLMRSRIFKNLTIAAPPPSDASWILELPSSPSRSHALNTGRVRGDRSGYPRQ